MSGLQQVHLRLNDAATGQPTPVRLRVTDAQGAYYAPLGRLASFATDSGLDVGANLLRDDVAWAIIDGACEIALPPGPIRIQAVKGLEYRPLDIETQLLAGKMSLRFAIERWCDLGKEGWYSGDTSCSLMSPHAALLEAAAQDLAVVDLLIREANLPNGAGHPIPTLFNITAFSGQTPALSRPGHLVAVNTLNDSPYGRLLLLNCHRVVYPLSFALGERWSLADWCDQCHRKKGLVVGEDWLARQAVGPQTELRDLALSKRLDAIRFDPTVPLDAWFDILNRGVKLPLVAGSGKDSNRHELGSWRTYANLSPGQPVDYAAWIEAVRAGRTFVTSGPIVRFTVDGQGPGAILAGGETSRKVVATATGLEPLERLDVIRGGVVVASATGTADLRVECNAASGSWIAVRCVAAKGTVAMSSPVYG